MAVAYLALAFLLLAGSLSQAVDSNLTFTQAVPPPTQNLQANRSNALFPVDQQLNSTTQNALVSSDNTLCTKIVPGLLRMSQGLDISELDLFPSDVSAPSGFRRTIFEYSCNVERTWADPSDPSDVYAIPDQVESVIPVPSGTLNIKTRVNEKMQQYKDSMAVKVGMEMSAGLFGSFSTSAGYKETQEKLLKTDKSTTETTSAESAFEMYYKNKRDLSVSANFRQSVDELPQSYSANPAAYDDFVRTFGTHYFDMAKFGGFLFEKNTVSNQYMESASERDINLNLQASFKAFVKVDTSTEMEQITSESRSEFLSNSELSFHHYGGISKKISDPDEGYLEEWKKSVSKQPWLFAGQVKPIETLIEDPAKRISMQTAVFVKLAKLYLGDARNAYSLAGLEMPSGVISKLQEIERKLANPSISVSELEQLNRDIAAIFAELQQTLDQNKLNKLDAGHHFDQYLRKVENDKSCECAFFPGLAFGKCMSKAPLPGISPVVGCKEYSIHYVTFPSPRKWIFVPRNSRETSANSTELAQPQCANANVTTLN